MQCSIIGTTPSSKKPAEETKPIHLESCNDRSKDTEDKNKRSGKKKVLGGSADFNRGKQPESNIK